MRGTRKSQRMLAVSRRADHHIAQEARKLRSNRIAGQLASHEEFGIRAESAAFDQGIRALVTG